jgi:hypothetical protein
MCKGPKKAVYITWEAKREMSDNDVIKLMDRNQHQFTPQQAAEWFLDMVKKGTIKRVLILYKDSEQPNVSFAQGSVLGNYTVADVNWDVDQFKRLHLSGDYEPVED